MMIFISFYEFCCFNVIVIIYHEWYNLVLIGDNRPNYRYPYYDAAGNGQLLYGYGGSELFSYNKFTPLEGIYRRWWLGFDWLFIDWFADCNVLALYIVISPRFWRQVKIHWRVWIRYFFTTQTTRAAWNYSVKLIQYFYNSILIQFFLLDEIRQCKVFVII